MKRTDLPAELLQVLLSVPYVTIASVCPDGKPWNTPALGFFDDELNLYWASWPKNQHSRNIGQNSHIFVVVFDSRAPEGEGLGLYLEMSAKVLTGKLDVQAARKVYTSTFGENLRHEPFRGECPRRLYKAVPHKIWYNSEAYVTGNFVDVRREVKPA